jgi:hypothetical protein
MCIVLIPAPTCALHMATISIGELTNILKLKPTEDITIVKQTDTALWLRCSGPGVKRHIMSWETRSTAEKEFAIRVKEDLWRHERVQKAKMWPVMQALFAAGLRPTWSRASVTWRTSEGRFFIHPGDLPWSLSASEILTYAKSGCTTLPLSQTPPQPRTSTQHVHSSCQTDVIAESIDTPLKHLVTALKQDLALAKQRIAAQAIQCCFWRQKYKALEAMVGPPRRTKTASSQTNKPSLAVGACVQTEPECASHADAGIQTEPHEDHAALVEQALAMQKTIHQQAQQMQQIQAHINLVASQADRVGKGKARR